VRTRQRADVPIWASGRRPATEVRCWGYGGPKTGTSVDADPRAAEQDYVRSMDVVGTLNNSSTEIIDEAASVLERSPLSHYERAGPDEERRRLQGLFEVVVEGIKARQLTPIVEYAETVAGDRYAAGFGISEVQTAFNVLEEAMWRRVVATTPPDQLAEAIGLLSTVLGAGKDALARTYVALASKQHVGSLDLRALFEGT
jgi:hypothetical protein